jgi:DNA-binding MarR family transcriptional regulator
MYSSPVTTSPLGDELLGVIARLHRWASRQAEFDVPPAQARLLAQVEELGPARIGDLAVADHTSQPTMSAQVGRLEQAGWVLRSADPADARASLITLSPAGAGALAEVRRARSAVVAPVIDRLPAADRERLADAVVVLREVLAAAASEEGPTPATEGH